MKRKVPIIIIYGVNGGGKTTLKNIVMDDPEINAADSISATTRKPREGEVHGKDYFFVKKDVFNSRDFIEFKEFPDDQGDMQTYGTPMTFVRGNIQDGRAIVLVLETEGVLEVTDKIEAQFGDVAVVVKAWANRSKKEAFKSLLDEGYTKEEAHGRLGRGDITKKIKMSGLDREADCVITEHTESPIRTIKQTIDLKQRYGDKNSLIKAVSKYNTLDEFKKDVLFHGTSATIKGEIRGGGYDGMVWTASLPTVAQNYIPNAGITLYYHKPTPSEMNMRCTINGYNPFFDEEILGQMGYELDMKFAEDRTVSSYTAKKDGESAVLPTRGEMHKHIIETLGYHDEDSPIKINSTFVNKKQIILPSEYKSPGRLFVVLGASRLDIADIAEPESDLMNVEYHQLDRFEQAEHKGYDAVRINDFSQSENFGNVGHKSVGLLPKGIEEVKGNIFSLNAVNYDWEESKDLRQTNTPEFNFEEIFEASREYVKKRDRENVITHDVFPNVVNGNVFSR